MLIMSLSTNETSFVNVSEISNMTVCTTTKNLILQWFY